MQVSACAENYFYSTQLLLGKGILIPLDLPVIKVAQATNAWVEGQE